MNVLKASRQFGITDNLSFTEKYSDILDLIGYEALSLTVAMVIVSEWLKTPILTIFLSKSTVSRQI